MVTSSSDQSPRLHCSQYNCCNGEGMSFCYASALQCCYSLSRYVWRLSGDGKPYHFLSRFFAPWGGIDEDPVTGSAHTILGPYWASQLQNAPQTMQARQCSPRGGDVQVTVDNSKGRVTVAGQAVTVSKGVLYLPT